MLKLRMLQQLPSDALHSELIKCCHSRKWTDRMLQRRPYTDRDDLLDKARDEWYRLDPSDWIEAFSAHPRIGDVSVLRAKFGSSKEGEEQAGAKSATEKELCELKDFNDEYDRKFGFVFLICATGKSAGEMLAALKQRIGNEQRDEILIAAKEHEKITEIRLVKLMEGLEPHSRL